MELSASEAEDDAQSQLQKSDFESMSLSLDSEMLDSEPPVARRKNFKRLSKATCELHNATKRPKSKWLDSEAYYDSLTDDTE